MFLLRPESHSTILIRSALILVICANSLLKLPGHPSSLTTPTTQPPRLVTLATVDSVGKEAGTPHDSLTPITAVPAADQGTGASANEAYGKLPLSFEANQGQIDSQVRFLSRGPDYSLFLSPTEAVFSLRQPPSEERSKR
jgi:hypothetical protein